MKLSGTIDIRPSAPVPYSSAPDATPVIKPLAGSFDVRVGDQNALIPTLDLENVRIALHHAERSGFNALSGGLRTLQATLQAKVDEQAKRSLYTATFDALFAAAQGSENVLGAGTILRCSSNGDARRIEMFIDQPDIAKLNITATWGDANPMVTVSGEVSDYGRTQTVHLTREPGKPEVITSTSQNGHVSHGMFAFSALEGMYHMQLTPALERALEMLTPAVPELAKFGRGTANKAFRELAEVRFLIESTRAPITVADSRRLTAFAEALPATGGNLDERFEAFIRERVRANPNAGHTVSTAEGEKLAYSAADSGIETKALLAELRAAEHASWPFLKPLVAA